MLKTRRRYVIVINQRLEKVYRAVLTYHDKLRIAKRLWPTAMKAEAYGKRLAMRLEQLEVPPKQTPTREAWQP